MKKPFLFLLLFALLCACGGAENNRINLRSKPDPFKSVVRPELSRNVDGVLSPPIPSGISPNGVLSTDKQYLDAAQKAVFGENIPQQPPLTSLASLSPLDQSFIAALGANLDSRVPLDFDREIYDASAQSYIKGPNNPIARALKPLQKSRGAKGRAINPLYEWQMIRIQGIPVQTPDFAQEGYRIDQVEQGLPRTP